MENHKFIDRFFQSQRELLDPSATNERDSNTLYTFLNCLHTTADRLKEDFNCDIKCYPEFKILRLIRNYFHHVGDVEEIRLKVLARKNVMASHSEHLIIPLETFAKSVKSFMDKTIPAQDDKKYHAKKKYFESEMASISKMFAYTDDLLNNLEETCNKPSLKLDGVNYELGFDIFKFCYNISNIIADKCRELDGIRQKKIIAQLESSRTSKNNIEKYDILCHPGQAPITTTKGFIYANKIELGE
ncbi:hypothetical protein NIPOLPBK_02766 [Stenotrophomonas maltophilia]|uniref:hypothetical protein n=1 Tax=Stenotrophomonas maltophilia TaxID=40324 RepID=UPI0012B054E0|nr:hypothetical protein [Stenotrophomonas maltophilia]QGL71672.1 hypothetical protein FEO85_09450 [Stenotrophomonas maltophilia]QNG69551.1 hypothetical protein NIPOLPBK_02766 [Stenotrophomonas maltophilia]WBL68039.1 hypothetical protein SMAL454_18730 [Stenotrophomonas maltophilia]